MSEVEINPITFKEIVTKETAQLNVSRQSWYHSDIELALQDVIREQINSLYIPLLKHTAFMDYILVFWNMLI